MTGTVKLTEAQRYALQALAAIGGDVSPARLGQAMMERPGVEARRRGGNRNSSQGLGRIGGAMGTRLVKMGLASRGFRQRDGGFERYGYSITPAGRALIPGGSDG